MACCRCAGSDGGSDSGIGIGGCSGDLAGNNNKNNTATNQPDEIRGQSTTWHHSPRLDMAWGSESCAGKGHVAVGTACWAGDVDTPQASAALVCVDVL